MEKKYDHIITEAHAQKIWAERNTYKFTENNEPIYSIDTPPPTVSGSLHIGHIFSYTQTDIIARYKRMSGFNVFYPFGFDDNGLPTERFVEKTKNIAAHSLSRSAFIDLCLTETFKVEKQFEALWQKIGLSVDWSLSYSTIDSNTRKISQASFIDLYKKDFIYRKDEPALYCTACRTTVAQAELDDAQKTVLFSDIKFKCDNLDLVISTTRPELLPSCVAIFYNPQDIRYQHLNGKKAIVPIFQNEVPLLADDLVDINKGTGLVMCCTFGDKTDILWFKKHHLKYKQSIGLDGKFNSQSGPLAGLSVKDARETILNLLKAKDALLGQKEITHSVNVHERCKKEIEYLILPQWFLKILPFKENLLKIADDINWYPAFMKSRYKNWVENINWDWCLSRQRFYGIPFPAWHCKDCNEIILADLKDLPIDPQEKTYNDPCPKCKSKNIVPDTDVMDTWNTSSLTPYICKFLLTKNFDNLFEHASSESFNFIPMSMRPQAHDIIRTWAFYTIAKTWMHQNEIPWKEIVISGHVLSTEKEKISKSQGNSPLAPENLLSKYPADAIRYWTASGSLGYDIAFSETQIGIGQKLLVKLWNAFRFVHQYTENYHLQDKPENLGFINEWILHSLNDSYSSYIKYFELNEFSLALDSIEKFFWNNFCDNYLEFIKDQLFNQDKYNKKEVDATLWTLHLVGFKILQLYSPFIPHATETLYESVYKKSILQDSIHQTKFKQAALDYNFEKSNDLMQVVMNIITQIRKQKSENQLSLKTEFQVLDIFSNNQQLLKDIEREDQFLKSITKSQTINYKLGSEQNSLASKEGFWHSVVNADVS